MLNTHLNLLNTHLNHGTVPGCICARMPCLDGCIMYNSLYYLYEYSHRCVLCIICIIINLKLIVYYVLSHPGSQVMKYTVYNRFHQCVQRVYNNQEHEKKGCTFSEIQKISRKTKYKKEMLATSVELGSLTLAGQDYSHYTIMSPAGCSKASFP